MILASLEQVWLDQPEWEQYHQDLEAAKSLSTVVWVALQMGLFVARMVVEETLSSRAQAPTAFGTCARCGSRLESKGWQARQMETLVGKIH